MLESVHRPWLGIVLLLLVTFATPAPGEETGPVEHGPRDRARVALTFDLCQVPGRPAGFDRAIIDTLVSTGTPATFFIGGDWMRTHPDETRELSRNPLFELGDHSWSHPDFRHLTPEAIDEQIRRTAGQMQALTGRTPTLFRFPFGTWTPESLKTVKAAGLTAIQWDVVTGDPDPAVHAKDILAEVTRHSRNGSIIIMHANGRGHHTAKALPSVIEALHAKGFSLVTVSELLQPKPSPTLQVEGDAARP